MINNKNLSLFLLIFVSFFNVLPIAHYKAKALENLIDNAADLKENSVIFKYKFFSKSDCKKYLGRKQVWERGFRPIQINIFNNTNKSLNLCTKHLSFPCVSLDSVIEYVGFKTGTRLLAWGIPSLILWPFVVPLIIEAFESPKSNSRLLKDYYSKTLLDQIIQPKCSVNGIVFVPKKHFKSDFSLILNDIDSKEQLILSNIK
jgi:hypothetical protein